MKKLFYFVSMIATYVLSSLLMGSEIKVSKKSLINASNDACGISTIPASCLAKEKNKGDEK